MRKKTMTAIRAHAVAEYPRECCGLVVLRDRRESYRPCRNMAEGTDHFILDPEDYAAAEEAGRITAVIHSHPDVPAAPSEADRVACEASGLPWFIVAVAKDEAGAVAAGELVGVAPEGYAAPLLGRPFAHGVLDCYSLVRDWYARERGITLRDFHRADGWWEAGKSGDLYMDLYAEAGFRPLTSSESIAAGDVVLMQIRSDRANHAGVFIGAQALKEEPDLFPVPDAMLHHLYGRDSERVVYGGYWREATRLVLRYKGEA
ncbi:C40 family peptidase [Achromobacter sp. ES-001]|uniref:C40 family peptidase n=1 Tax=Achromobacter sp. ES-001 TaxID=2860286 RepID=UPI001C63FDEF|nr:C40 family peptidase [Achromobacter sp. ES-001]QYJ20173.1 C40 family peptidase [Achromobacter sp. ES-001]